MRSPPLATLRFLNGRGTWDPGPHKGQRGASLKNAGLKGPPQLRWVPWPPEQTRCPECEQQGLVHVWLSVSCSVGASELRGRGPALGTQRPAAKALRILSLCSPSTTLQGMSRFCSLWMILSPETERCLCLVPKAWKHYAESQRTSASQFRNRLPRAQLRGKYH